MEQRIQGAKKGVAGLEISYLFFADDSLLCKHGTTEDAIVMKSILQDYEEASCQSINYQKSSILFGAQMEEEVIKDIMEVLQMPKCTGEGKYLGLPIWWEDIRNKYFSM